MISYEPFYETLFKKNMTEYELIFKHGISANTLYRMKKGEAITTKTLDTLCFILKNPKRATTKDTFQIPFAVALILYFSDSLILTQEELLKHRHLYADQF